MIVQVRSKDGRAIRTAGNPIRIDNVANDVTTTNQAPGLDEHRVAILGELLGQRGGYSRADVASDDDAPASELWMAAE